MSLLDDVSIVVTPNGYKAGELYAVKPTIASGTEQVVNGDFSNGEAGWSISDAAASATQTIVAGGLKMYSGDASDNSNRMSQTTSTMSGQIGKSYILKLTATDFIGPNQGSIRLDGVYDSSNVIIFTAATPEVRFIAYRNFTYIKFFAGGVQNYYTIDNVSLKEDLGADMDVTRATAATRVDEAGLVNYAEIIGSEEVTNGDFELNSDWNNFSTPTTSEQSTEQSHTGTYSWKVIADATQEGIFSPNNFSITNGNSYSVSLWIYSVSGNSIKSGLNNTNVSVFTERTVIAGQWTNITYEATATSTGASYISILSQNSLNFYVDNVSVKEVTRDNVPRIDYSGGGCPHILAEPQSTNLFINSIWDGGTDNVSAPTSWSLNDISDPVYSYSTSQYTSGKKINIQCSGSRLIMSQTVTIPSNSLVNVSVKVKYISGSTPLSNIASSLNAPADFIRTYYYNNVLVSAAFIPTEDGILEMKTSSVTGGVSGIRLGLGTGGNSTGHIELDMPQCETLTYRTSFIPTTTSTVTRNQDIFTRDGIGSLINSEEGVLFVEMAALSNDLAYRRISINDSSVSNRIGISYDDVSNRIRGQIIMGGVSIFLFFTSTDITEHSKIALKYKTNDFALWVDGIERDTDTSSVSLPSNTLNNLSFDNGGGGNVFFGKVKQLQVFKTALTDSELATLTTI